MTEDLNAENSGANQIGFHYIKGNFFRVIHVDGAIGGVTPHRGIHMALYNERAAIPQQTMFIVGSDGQLGEEVREARVVRDGIVREVEVDVIMTAETAKAMIAWLQQIVERIETSGQGLEAAN